MKIEKVHIDQIKVGDTVLDSDLINKTVGKRDLKYNSFMGITLWGDSYHLGKILVPRVLE